MSKRETKTHHGKDDGTQSSEYKTEWVPSVPASGAGAPPPPTGEWLGRYVPVPHAKKSKRK